jgi:pyruvate-formate lyase-activating enzyme
MLEYRPWSRAVMQRTLAAYREGRFTVFDLELSGACNLDCAYCDSPQRDIFATWSLPDIRRLCSGGQVEWLFVCGIGEPLVKPNYDRFVELLRLCYECGVKCSTFTNGVLIDGVIKEAVRNGTLSLLVKLDSLVPEIGDHIYGQQVTTGILRNLEDLAELRCETGNTTNLGVSIVPTRLNVDEVPEIAEHCVNLNLFPLIGQLEDAGRAKTARRSIGLSDQEISAMRIRVSSQLHQDYIIPTCPAVIGGVHVGHGGKVIVDRFTGLSCHWFWLKEPRLQELTDISTGCEWTVCERDILKYRATRVADVEEALSEMAGFPLGGCGGNVRGLLRDYVQIEKNRIDGAMKQER